MKKRNPKGEALSLLTAAADALVRKKLRALKKPTEKPATDEKDTVDLDEVAKLVGA